MSDSAVDLLVSAIWPTSARGDAHEIHVLMIRAAVIESMNEVLAEMLADLTQSPETPKESK